MKRLLFACLLASGCGQTPMAPTPTAVRLPYDIHIPDALVATSAILALQSSVDPNGWLLSPDQAQQQFDYRALYGRANVLADGTCAPVADHADRAAFYGADGVLYQWEGHVRYTKVEALCR